MKRKSAREFYYENYGGGSPSTIQQAWSFDLLKELTGDYVHDFSELKDKLVAFQPRYSNDFALDHTINDILAKAHPEIGMVLANCFVVSLHDREFRAFVRAHRCDIEGEIVFFSQGMSNAIFAYVILFAWHIFRDTAFGVHRDSSSGRDLRATSPELTEDKVTEKLHALASELKECQAKWSEDRLIEIEKGLIDSQLSGFWKAPQPIQGFASSFAACVTKFVVAHEFAHYLLGHLDGEDYYKNYSKIYVESWLSSATPEVFREYEADFVAVAINSGQLDPQRLIGRDYRVSIDAGHGIALGLTIFGQMLDPFATSTTHPSMSNRFSQCEALFWCFMVRSDYESMMSVYRSFQRLLFEAQDRGLGARGDDSKRQMMRIMMDNSGDYQ